EPRGRSCARHDGQGDHLDRKCVGPLSDRRRSFAEWMLGKSSGRPKSPRALAGRLRRVQASLRALGIEIAFSREGRGGTRIIRMTASHENSCENTVSTVSTVSTVTDRESSKPVKEP